MLEFTAAEVLQAFESAKNINSSFKKFLKNDVAGDAKNEKFVKSLKQVFGAKDSSVKEAFIAKHLPEFQPHFLVLGRYAYIDQVDTVTEQIITKYAEEFNTTYTKSENGVAVQNQERFKQIIQEVAAAIEEAFNKQIFPKSNFMKSVLLNSIFDLEVLKVALPLVS